MTEKMCTKCRKVKPLSEYHKNAKAHDGLAAHCKECRIAYCLPRANEWNKTHRAQWLENNRRYKKRVRAKTNARRSATYHLCRKLGFSRDDARKMECWSNERIVEFLNTMPGRQDSRKKETV